MQLLQQQCAELQALREQQVRQHESALTRQAWQILANGV